MNAGRCTSSTSPYPDRTNKPDLGSFFDFILLINHMLLYIMWIFSLTILQVKMALWGILGKINTIAACR